MENEIWKDVIGYEGLYQISSLGNIKSFKRNKEIILKPSVGDRGYYVVTLSNKRKIHQLVAEAFLNHTSNGMTLVVDHINDNKLDNRVENLQLVTQRENVFKTQGNYSSKYKGVCWDKSRNKWLSQIRIKGKVNYLGIFNCELSASLAYQNALKTLA